MSSRYTQYYQSGGSLRDIGQIYKGPESYYYRNQRGEGIGDFFATAYRFLNPLLQSGLSVLGNQAIRSGTNILSDLGKKDLGTIVREQGEQAIKNLSEKAIDKIKRSGGRKVTTTITQEGKGRRIIKHRNSKISLMCRRRQAGSGGCVRKKRGRKPGRKGIKRNLSAGLNHIAVRRGIGRNYRKAKRIQIGGRRKTKRRSTKRRTTTFKRKRTHNLDIFN